MVSKAQKELETVKHQLDDFEKQINDLTLDRMNQAPKEEKEPQTKISQSEASKMPEHYLKPSRVIGSREKFNERFDKKYEFDKEYVYFIAENKEIVGETIELWTKPYPGCPAEFWQVPTNKPIWGPRYLAEQIKRANYHRLKMDMKPIISSDSTATYHGTMVVDSIIQRLDAYPSTKQKSIFMGANSFG